MDPKEQLESLRRTLAEEEGNLLFIEEQKAKYVLETEIPVTLIKEERRKQKRIAELRQRIGELERSQVSESPIQEEDVRDKELAYLDGLLKRYEYWRDHYTPLAGIAEVRAAVKDGPRLDLPMPFIPREFEMLTRHGFGERVEVEREQFDDLREAIAKHRRIILLGDPGSGKTTTLWRLAYDYALEAKHDRQMSMLQLVRQVLRRTGKALNLRGSESRDSGVSPLPVFVPLGHYNVDSPF